jgi:hypothetical protein
MLHRSSCAALGAVRSGQLARAGRRFVAGGNSNKEIGKAPEARDRPHAVLKALAARML